MKERYRQAVEYMEWFKPAWEQLSDDDRYCLETFYREIVETARQYINGIGGFEKFAEWGLLR